MRIKKFILRLNFYLLSPDDNNIDNMFTPQNEVNRMMFNNQQHPQLFSQQQRMNHNNSDMNHVHPSMSKFFDFHKQQQNQQQNQFMVNSNPMAEQHNMANLENHHRMNPTSFMDQSNGKTWLIS